MKLLKPNIAKLEAKKDIRKLSKAMAHEDPVIRKSAIRSLGKLKERSVLQKVIHRLVDTDDAVRLGAVDALNAIDPNWRNAEESKQTASSLLEVVAKPHQARPIRAFLRKKSLSLALSYPFAPAALRRRLMEPVACAAMEIIRLSIWALGEIGDSRATNALINAACDADLRRSAEEALVKLRRADPLQFLNNALLGGDAFDSGPIQVVDRVYPNWQEGTPAGRLIPDLVSALNDKQQNDCGRRSRQAAQALGRIGGRQSIEALLEALKDGSMRTVAAQALGQIGDPVALEPLILALAYENRGLEIELALKKIDGNWRSSDAAKRAVPRLISELKSPQPNRRHGAAQVLGQIGNPLSVEPLVQAMKTNDGILRGAAAEALGEIGDPLAVPALRRALEEESVQDWVRKAATTALEKIAKKE